MTHTVSLYQGTVNIEFDEVNHFYRVVGIEAKPDGVTTILELVPKFLLNWAASCAVKHISDGYLARLEAGEMPETTSFLALCDEAKGAWRRTRDTAGDIGTLVHEYAEKMVNGEKPDLPPITASEYAGCVAFKAWWEATEHRLATYESERIIYSKRLFYCGTCDLFGYGLDGQPVVFDIKTSSGFYDSQPLQLAGYATALEEDVFSNADLNVCNIKRGVIIHIDKKTGKLTTYNFDITPELKKDWEAVRIAWRAVKRNQDRHKQIKENEKCQRLMNTTQVVAAL